MSAELGFGLIPVSDFRTDVCEMLNSDELLIKGLETLHVTI